MHKTGLVLEGGGMRSMFTNGVLDVLMQEGIQLDAVVGVSAGALFGCNYKSRQQGRALRYNMRFTGDPRYMSWHSWFSTGDFVNVPFSYETLPYHLDPFDFDTFRNNPIPFWSVSTDIINARPVYTQIQDAYGTGLQYMRASASMPVFARPVHLDGGISDSIPLQFLQEQGYKRCIVVLTQPPTYRKTRARLVYWFLRLWCHRYPQVARMMNIRHKMYNSQLDYVALQARKGNALLIYPDRPLDIGRLEMNRPKMQAIYDAGREKTLQMLDEIRHFVSDAQPRTSE